MVIFDFLSQSKESYALLNARALTAWLNQQPLNNLLGLQEAAADLLRELLRKHHKPDQNVIDTVFLLDERLVDLRKTLISDYLASTRTSTTLEARLWNAATTLSGSFASAYDYLIKESARELSEKRWVGNLAGLVGRLVYHRGLDSKFHLFRHENWIPARWRELHANYMLACKHQVEDVAMPLTRVEESSRGVSISEQYVRVLLQQLMTMGNSTALQLEWAISTLPSWAYGLELTTTAKVAEGFYLDLSSGEGLRRRRADVSAGQYLYLDPTILHSRMRENVLALRDDLESADKDERRGIRERVDVLRKIASAYSPSFKPRARKGVRVRETGSAPAIFGFKPICSALAQIDEAKARKVPGENYNYSETAALYVYGFFSEELKKRKEKEEKEADRGLVLGQVTQVVNRSDTGCCLLVPTSQRGTARLGTLVSLCDETGACWSLAVVRRLRKVNANDLEVGLQYMASSISRVVLRTQRRVRKTNVLQADGPDANSPTDNIEALYLKPFAAVDPTEQRTLVLPSAEYTIKHPIVVQERSETFGVLLREILERHSEWTWARAEVLGPMLQQGAFRPGITPPAGNEA